MVPTLHAGAVATDVAVDYLLYLGAIVAVAVLFVLGYVRRRALWRSRFGTDDSPPPEAKINCPACGARTVHRDACEYCGESLPDDARPDTE